MFHVKQKRVAFRCPAGACLLCRLPTLPFVYLLAPIPPTRARRALFPAGRGRPRLFYARGFAPCIPGAEPGRHWLFLSCQCFLPPSPRPPSRREGGDFFVLFCRGLAPPAPLRLSPRGTGYFLSCQRFFAPSPRPPSPVGKGEIFCFFLCKGLRPCIPGAKPGRHWRCFQNASS